MNIFIKHSRRAAKMAGQENLVFISPHEYINSTSTSKTICTEHLLNNGRESQTPRMTRNNPCIMGQDGEKGGKKKKKKQDGTHALGCELKETRSYCTQGGPLTGSEIC